MRSILLVLTTVMTVCLGAVNASAAGPIRVNDRQEIGSHLIGEAPVIRMAWVDLTRHSGGGFWSFQIKVGTDGRVAQAVFKEGPIAYRKEAVHAAKALRFKPFERNGHAVPVQFDYEISGRSEDYAGPSDRSFPRDPDPRQVRIALRRTSCFGTCPDYWVELRGDGQVTYWGAGHVVVEGEHRWHVSPVAVARLLELFRKTDYFKLEGYYKVEVTDLPTYVTRLSLGQHKKFVLDYGGDGAALVNVHSDAAGPRMPPAVTELEHAIDNVAGLSSWVQGDENTLAALRKAKWNFRSQAAGRGLHQLVRDCKIGLASDFMEAGAPINVQGWGLSTMGWAAHCGNLKLVRLLESKGALTRRRDAQAFLEAAVRSGYPDFVEIALKHGANVKGTGVDGIPLTMVAADAFISDLERPSDTTLDLARVISRLIAAGADPNARDKEGNTALHEAMDAAIARALIVGGADPNARNASGETPLFNKYSSETMPALVEAGADVMARDHEGRTALFSQRYPETAAALIHAGVDVNARDLKGQTALETAGSEEVALMLLDAGAVLPADVARLESMVGQATEEKWAKLLPVLIRAMEARGVGATP